MLSGFAGFTSTHGSTSESGKTTPRLSAGQAASGFDVEASTGELAISGPACAAGAITAVATSASSTVPTLNLSISYLLVGWAPLGPDGLPAVSSGGRAGSSGSRHNPQSLSSPALRVETCRTRDI